MVGDSHARQWTPAIETLAEKHGDKAYFLVRVGCPGADITPWMGDGSGPSYKCEEFQDWAAGQIEEMQPDVTIIGSAVNPEGWTDDDGNQVTDPDQVATMFKQGMRRQVERVSPNSDRVILIGDPPSTPEQGSICLSKRSGSLESCMTTADPWSLRVIAAARKGAKSAGAEYVDTAPWFCVDTDCPRGDRALRAAPRPPTRHRRVRRLPHRGARPSARPRPHRRRPARARSASEPR